MSSAGDRTTRAVEGALRDCITQHGPVTLNRVPSATKRVVAQLRSAASEAPVLAPGMDNGLSQTEALHKRLEKLRHGHNHLQGRHQRLGERLKATEALCDLLAASLRIATADYDRQPGVLASYEAHRQGDLFGNAAEVHYEDVKVIGEAL